VEINYKTGFANHTHNLDSVCMRLSLLLLEQQDEYDNSPTTEKPRIYKSIVEIRTIAFKYFNEQIKILTTNNYA
jgi:hypothetical protein